MSQPGIGAMLHMLSGGSPNDKTEFYGKTISDVKFSEDEIEFAFTDGSGAKLWDDGQSCCEYRYMTTDDDVKTLIGGAIIAIESKEATEEEDGDWGDVHECIFVEIQTDKGFITIANHNKHNGYYGGFGLSMMKIDKEEERDDRNQ